MKAIQEYFPVDPVIQFIMLQKVVLAFEYVDGMKRTSSSVFISGSVSPQYFGKPYLGFLNFCLKSYCYW